MRASRKSPKASLGFPELHRAVCFGEAGGKIIWQPRIQCWYSDRKFAGRPLPAPYEGMTIPQIHRALGCSARCYWFNPSFKPVEHPAVLRVSRELNSTDVETVIETPVGRQVIVERNTDSSARRIHLKWQIATPDELKVATWRVENTSWAWDQAAFDKAFAEWGDLGAPTVFMPRVNVQDLYINTMGTQNAIYALYDWTDLVEAYFRALDESHDRLMDVILKSPIEVINFGDNLHCGTLPPKLFTKYVLPAYQRRCEKLHRGRKFLHAHWDGDTQSLLPFAKETGLDGIEAITPKPQGDVTLEEVKDALGDKMFLIDGIPAVYFDETFPVSVLEDCARRCIELFAPKLILGISDEISSTGDIERIRVVGRIVDEYNASRGT